jgi:hypothetical protein
MSKSSYYILPHVLKNDCRYRLIEQLNHDQAVASSLVADHKYREKTWSTK